MKNKCLLENNKNMKKKSHPRLTNLFLTLFNVVLWFDWERMKSLTRYLINGIKKFFVPQVSKDTESFAAAKKRLNLTDHDLLVRQKGLFRVSMLMFAFSILLFCWAIYHFIFLHILGGILSLVVMCIALVLAFRYHFWYYQIKAHKLGCSIHEWYRKGLMGDK